MRLYPKAKSPVTPEVLEAANLRAERWRLRCIEARADRTALVVAIRTLAGEWDQRGYQFPDGTRVADRLRAALDGQAAEDIWARNAAIFKHEAETPMRGHDATCCARAALTAAPGSEDRLAGRATT